MNNPGQYTVPFECRDYADYKRAKEVMELLNRQNDDYPITCTLGSGPKDPKIEGPRFIDIHCASMAKIQHFQRMGDQLDRDIKFLNQVFDLDELGNPKQTKSPLMGHPLLGEIFGFPPIAGGTTEDALKTLKELQEKLRRAREEGPQ